MADCPYPDLFSLNRGKALYSNTQLKCGMPHMCGLSTLWHATLFIVRTISDQEQPFSLKAPAN